MTGLSAKFLSSLIACCRQEGLGEMFVAAHEEDAGALDFYRAAGGREEKVRHFSYSGRGDFRAVVVLWSIVVSHSCTEAGESADVE
jgi:hypothetical protein